MNCLSLAISAAVHNAVELAFIYIQYMIYKYKQKKKLPLTG